MDPVNRVTVGSIASFSPSPYWTPAVKEKAERELEQMILDLEEKRKQAG
jgi:hypothetical protein